MKISILTCCLLISVLIASSSAMVVDDTIKSDSNWAFLSKFCFAEGQGNLTWTATSQSNSVKLLLYDDEPDSWPTIYQKFKFMSCQQLVNASKVSFKGSVDERGLPIDNTGKAQTILIGDHVRPRFWYVAVADCANKNLNVKYDLIFLNPGGNQFSFDQNGLFALYTIFFFVFAIMTGYHIYNYLIWHKANNVHPIIKLLTIALGTESLAMFCNFVHLAAYGNDGVGLPGLSALGDISDMMTQLFMFLIVLLLSKGWTITTNALDEKKRLAIALGVLSALYLVLFVWEYAGLDPASSLYVYETAPGILLLFVRLVVMGWFLWNIRLTKAVVESDPAKSKLFTIVAVLYTLWFVILPFIVLIAAVLDPWVRAKTVQTLYVLMNTIAIGVLVVLLAPSRASKYFKVSIPDLMDGTTPYDTL